MTDYWFEAEPAVTEDGELVQGATLQAFALADTGDTTPLTVTLDDGTTGTTFTTTAIGLRPRFMVVDHPRVRLRAGVYSKVVVSWEWLLEAALAAQLAAEQARDAAVEAASGAAAPSGIEGAPSTWPNAFPPAPHVHRTADLMRADGLTPLAAVVMALLAATDAQTARAAIGAGTSSQVLVIGTQPGQVAAGDHSHSQYVTTDQLTLALAGVGGGSAYGSNMWAIAYVSGAYEAVPAFVTFANGYRFLVVAGPVPYTVTPPTGITVLFSQTA